MLREDPRLGLDRDLLIECVQIERLALLMLLMAGGRLKMEGVFGFVHTSVTK